MCNKLQRFESADKINECCAFECLLNRQRIWIIITLVECSMNGLYARRLDYIQGAM